MIDWMGVDPGGTEQLWDPAILISVLEIFKSREPFSRGDKKSPIFLDLEDAYPNITWRGSEADGTFRPIFRKTNPWVKLGLIGPETFNEYVTPLGEELLAGESNIADVFISALKSHREQDGSRSYATMCAAATALPDERYTLVDVEFAISKGYASGEMTLKDSLSYSRKNQLAFPNTTRRIRTLRSFMNALVSAGALSYTIGGWTLNNREVALEIFAENNYQLPAIQNEVFDASSEYSLFSEIVPGHRVVAPFKVNTNTLFDPTQRALLLEKAYSAHELLIEECAEIVQAAGLSSVEDANSFDLAIISKQLIAEMKSINKTNCISQLRKAVAQLPEYRWKFKEIFFENSHLIIVLDKSPLDFVNLDYISYIENDRRIRVFWKTGEGIIGTNGIQLSRFISEIPLI